MEINDKKLLVCNCEGTMPLDGGKLGAALAAIGADFGDGGAAVATNLGRVQFENFPRDAHG